MKFFVTGVCLQGNKGGPALALSIMKAIRSALPDATFVFSVPPSPAYQHEQRWAEVYGLSVVEDTWSEPRSPWNPFNLLKYGLADSLRSRRRLGAWTAALRACDVVLDMTAISYVGPPEGNENHALGMRYRFFKACQREGRVFRAWTQSYGPFSTPRIAMAAKEDLSGLPRVYCRGEESMTHVTKLIPGKDCRNYPDAAIILEYHRDRGAEFIKKAFGRSLERKLVSISLSSVQFRKSIFLGDDCYVDRQAKLINCLIERGYAVLIVPHTYEPACHDPEHCDFALSLAVLGKVDASPYVSIILRDLSPVDLKSIIACSDVHIGGRYHSVVAALSSGVPAVSISWHHKYLDVMTIYGQSEFVVACNSPTLITDAVGMAERLIGKRDEVSRLLKGFQDKNSLAVFENARDLVAGLVPTNNTKGQR